MSANATGALPLLAGLQRQAGNGAVLALMAAGAPIQRDRVEHAVRRRLTWRDFRGIAPSDSPYDAATASGWSDLPDDAFTASYRHDGRGNYRVTATADRAKLDIRSYVDTSESWVKPDHRSSELLQHEQGHFDITHVIGERTERAMKREATSITRTGQGDQGAAEQARAQALDDVIRPVVKKEAAGRKVNAYAHCRYDGTSDVGTDHGIRAAQQARWNRWISMDLPTFTVPLPNVDERMAANGCSVDED